MTERLTSKQRAYLRGLAHDLKPVVHVGHGGLEPPVIESILEAFNTRELLKVKVLETAPGDARETAREIEEAVADVHVAQTIGRTIVLYRPDPDEPEIQLPG